MQILSAEALLLLFLIAITLVIIFVKDMLAVMVIYCAFSFCAMVLYIFSGAPDVAFTEAVIGVISTLYFVISLKTTDRMAHPFRRSEKGVLLLGTIVLITVTVLFALLVHQLPVIGDPDSPPNTHISDFYIGNAYAYTHAPNLVTAVLADFRGFDTMWETTVMFLAGMSVFAILSNREEGQWSAAIYTKDERFDGIEIRMIMAMIIPVIMVFAVYVLMHGEISLGGGFQAGALLAMAYILFCTFGNPARYHLKFTPHVTIALAAAGVLMYGTAGILPMFFGGKFLEYARLPFGGKTAAQLHATGILIIEIGVTLAVMATIITILNAILIRNELTQRMLRRKKKTGRKEHGSV